MIFAHSWYSSIIWYNLFSFLLLFLKRWILKSKLITPSQLFLIMLGKKISKAKNTVNSNWKTIPKIINSFDQESKIKKYSGLKIKQAAAITDNEAVYCITLSINGGNWHWNFVLYHKESWSRLSTGSWWCNCWEVNICCRVNKTLVIPSFISQLCCYVSNT